MLIEEINVGSCLQTVRVKAFLKYELIRPWLILTSKSSKSELQKVPTRKNIIHLRLKAERQIIGMNIY